MGIDYKNFAVNYESTVDDQVNALVDSHVFDGETLRLQADCHAGKGCVVGTCLTYSKTIVPNIVGVDIGCRVSAVPLFVDAKDIDLKRFDEAICNRVPSGRYIRFEEHQLSYDFPYDDLCCWEFIGDNENRYRLSMGTLGSGNHFISIEVSDSGMPYLIIHTGSRNLGLRVANHYQQLAVGIRDNMRAGINSNFENLANMVKDMRECPNKHIAELFGEHDAILETMVSDDLAYLPHDDFVFDDYLHDMDLVVRWSYLNHKAIITDILGGYGFDIDEELPIISSVHNYVDTEHGIIRKGAIAAYDGQLGIIPMNMRDGSLIVRGKGNPDYLCSAPHGAGRIMSRAQAKRTLSVNAFEDEMSGIYSSTVCESTLDEAPEAYKPIDYILPAIEDTVDVIERTHPIYNFKAKE